MYCSEQNAGQPGVGEEISSTGPGPQTSTASRGGGSFKVTVNAGSFAKTLPFPQSLHIGPGCPGHFCLETGSQYRIAFYRDKN